MKAKAKKVIKATPTKAKSAKAKPAKTKKKSTALEGEGSYTASRNYDRGTEKFIAKNKSKITKMARDAEKALEGPEGKSLRKAEKAGKAKARR
jgi:hypothetical protein